MHGADESEEVEEDVLEIPNQQPQEEGYLGVPQKSLAASGSSDTLTGSISKFQLYDKLKNLSNVLKLL